jgi:capsular polysaccharide biosynthesis protein
MPESESLPRSLQRYTMVLRRQWWVTALVAVVAVGATLAYVKQATPVYSASSKVVVGQGQTLFAPGLSVNYVAVTSTIGSLLQSNIVAEDTIRRLGLHITPNSLLSNLSVSALPDGAVIDVSYADTNEARAVQVLSTIGSIFTRLMSTTLTAKARTTGQQAVQPVSAAVFDPAHADPGLVSPHTSRSLAIAVILGLVAGILLAFLRDALSSSIKSEAEAEEAYGAPSIGTLPEGVLGVGVHQVAGLPFKPRVRITEAFKMLTARLRYSTSMQRGVIVVIGARPQDGKSTVSAHLAAGLAAGGADVVAVEADLHRPALHGMLGVEPGQPGINDLGTAGSALDTSLITIDLTSPAPDQGSKRRRPALVGRRTDVEPDAEPGAGSVDFEFEDAQPGGRLRLLPAGTSGLNPMNALSLGNASSLILRLRTLADYVVVDTPPLLLSGDAYPLIQLADAVVVVCRRGATRQHEAVQAREILRSLGVGEYSVVLTESDEADRDYYGYAPQ